jgi:hypothetical protein
MRVPNLSGLAQQVPDEGDTFTAARLFAESVIYHRYGAILAIGVGTKIAIGDPVAETDVHSHRNLTLMTRIYLICEQFAISLATISTYRVELPHPFRTQR